jgi:hypothetical protein
LRSERAAAKPGLARFTPRVMPGLLLIARCGSVAWRGKSRSHGCRPTRCLQLVHSEHLARMNRDASPCAKGGARPSVAQWSKRADLWFVSNPSLPGTANSPGERQSPDGARPGPRSSPPSTRPLPGEERMRRITRVRRAVRVRPPRPPVRGLPVAPGRGWRPASGSRRRRGRRGRWRSWSRGRASRSAQGCRTRS